ESSRWAGPTAGSVVAGVDDGRHPDLWAAGIDIVGIANFVTFLETPATGGANSVRPSTGRSRRTASSWSPSRPSTTSRRFARPSFVLHGENDPRVPVGEAHQIVEEAGEHVPVRELIFEDEGHGFTKLENRIEAYEAIVEFLDEHV
ncbi:S9 family peptidase, partial [Halogeometricum sp. CBA1124]|uniref:alpha/beta hydrolase family protein n=1 Tax=Halogeometricum sp. CBA1124 TaxID=2668071 RepID=UPI001E446DD4